MGFEITNVYITMLSIFFWDGYIFIFEVTFKYGHLIM